MNECYEKEQGTSRPPWGRYVDHGHKPLFNCIAKHMINPRISAVWSTTKQIAPFSCTSRVQDVHTKAEVVHLTPGLLGLGVLFNCHGSGGKSAKTRDEEVGRTCSTYS